MLVFWQDWPWPVSQTRWLAPSYWILVSWLEGKVLPVYLTGTEIVLCHEVNRKYCHHFFTARLLISLFFKTWLIIHSLPCKYDFNNEYSQYLILWAKNILAIRSSSKLNIDTNIKLISFSSILCFYTYIIISLQYEASNNQTRTSKVEWKKCKVWPSYDWYLMYGAQLYCGISRISMEQK